MTKVIQAKGQSEATLRKLGVNSFRSVLGGKAEGTAVNFEATGDIAVVTSQFKNEAGENITSAYALGKGGYRLKLNADFKPADYTAGTVISCVVAEAEIDGRKAKWLTIAD